MSNQIVVGSIAAIAASTGKSIAESFINASLVCIVDTSASMEANDAANGRTRYAQACLELENIQRENPGKIAVISFSNEVVFCAGGVPQYQGAGTDLARALQFAKTADVPGMRFVVISDGEPNDEDTALVVAKTYQGRIDVIYVGREGGSGRAFLARLAKAAGGQAVLAESANLLGDKIALLLKG